MCPAAYYSMIMAENHKTLIRQHMVECAIERSISEAARVFQTTRTTVRKWLRRYRGGQGLRDRSRRPERSPNKTPPHIEEAVVDMRKKTRYGPHKLRDWLIRTQGLDIPHWTIRNILYRNNLVKKGRKRTACYPAFWAWDTGEPFVHAQVDVKDVRDKKTLGTRRTTHLGRCGLYRYQWTFIESKSRMRLLAYSRSNNVTNGIAFLVLCTDWIRSWSLPVPDKIQLQSDWGGEFGGDNPDKVERINRRYLRKRGAELCRYPKGRKQYNGRVERSHRSDDEEFYMPLLLSIRDPDTYLTKAFQWLAFYNLYRPHYGHDMNRKTPVEKLRELGLDVPDTFALMPPVDLEKIAVKINRESGYHVPAKYTNNSCAHG